MELFNRKNEYWQGHALWISLPRLVTMIPIPPQSIHLIQHLYNDYHSLNYHMNSAHNEMNNDKNNFTLHMTSIKQTLSSYYIEDCPQIVWFSLFI